MLTILIFFLNMIKIGFFLLVFLFMSFTWAEARRQVRGHALKDFPCTTQVRNFYTVDSTTQDKDLKS